MRCGSSDGGGDGEEVEDSEGGNSKGSGACANCDGGSSVGCAWEGSGGAR